jgi:hypothetical protein
MSGQETDSTWVYFKWVITLGQNTDMAPGLGNKHEQQRDILLKVEEIGVLGLVSPKKKGVMCPYQLLVKLTGANL